MNRREFLQSLAAIGTAITIDPSLLAHATEPEIETAWAALADEPRIFYASEHGTLTSGFEPDWPTSRKSLLGLPDLERGRDALISYLDNEPKAGRHVEYLFDAAQWEGDVGDAENWREWLTRGDDDLIDTVSNQIEDWLRDDADGDDWEYADLHGLSERGDAMQFFRNESEVADLLGVVIIEGEHPGSTYYAAELRCDIDEANAIAEAEGLPIRFSYGDD